MFFIVKSRTMLVIITLYFVALLHQSRGSQNLEDLLKKYPTWSFEVESIETLMKDTVRSVKDADPVWTEKMLWAKFNATLAPGSTHIVRKVGDPKWIQAPEKLPRHFDARDKWKECSDLIGNVEDEGPCNTDSPAVVSSVMGDRYCIFTKGAAKEALSQEMLAGCAEWCTNAQYIGESWRYATKFGIPTGGPHGSKKGCLPYNHAPCLHGNISSSAEEKRGLRKLKPCSEDMTYDHDCPTKCSNSNYQKSIDDDRRKCKTFYVTSRHEFCIRNEIYTYGSVVTSAILYDDFYENPNGMYTGKPSRKFVAWDKYFKLIGWGEENKIKYWLAVNSWDQWGDKVFKIPRGVNYDYVEFLLSTCVYDDFDD